MKKYVTLAIVIAAAGAAYAMSGKPKTAENMPTAATAASPSMPQQELPQQPAPPPTPEARAAALKITDNDSVMGKADAPVTIIEYASLSCPHCAAFETGTLPQLEAKYINTGKVKFVFRNFPLNPPALAGAMLLKCVDRSQYYTFAKVMFEQQSQWAYSGDFMQLLEKIANLGGVSGKQFSDCMANKTFENDILALKKQAIDSLEVKSTPTFFINGEQVMGNHSMEEISKVVEKHLTSPLAPAVASPAAPAEKAIPATAAQPAAPAATAAEPAKEPAK